MAQPLIPSQTLQGVGTPVNFGFTSDGTNNGIADQSAIFSGYLLQSTDYENGSDKEDVRCLQGDIVSQNFYDLHQKANLRMFITGTGKANAIANTTLTNITPGTIINITKCASHPDLVGTNWCVQAGAKIAGDITKSAEITIPLEKRPGIVAVQAD